jgi:uncharacterized protein (TIGR02611 family)
VVGMTASPIFSRTTENEILQPMKGLKRKWKRIPVGVRKPLVFIVGSTVVLTGLVMLVFPGPGWAAIFVGFAILATEFAFAEKVRDWLVMELRRIIKAGKQFWRSFRQRR